MYNNRGAITWVITSAITEEKSHMSMNSYIIMNGTT